MIGAEKAVVDAANLGQPGRAPVASERIAIDPQTGKLSGIELAAVELDADTKARRNRRSIAIALALGFLVVLFYAATMVRLGANVVNRAY